MFHAAYTAVYCHVVVVKDNQQIVGGGRGVVQALKGQSATHASVADDGYYMTVFLTFLAAATAMPKAAEMEFEACPQVKVS